MEAELVTRMPAWLVYSIVCIVVVVCVVTLVFTSFFVWIPDVIFSRIVMLSPTHMMGGHEFTVCQKWNNGDFYDTFLKDEYEDKSFVFLLDTDDKKRWTRPSVQIVSRSHEVRITFGQEMYVIYDCLSRSGHIHRAGHDVLVREALPQDTYLKTPGNTQGEAPGKARETQGHP
jgi:hypothetical protein